MAIGLLFLSRISAGIDGYGRRRQEPEDRLADDEVSRHRSPDARIGALVSVVAHDEILRRAESGRRSVVRSVIGGDVRLGEGEALRMGGIDNGDDAAINGDRFTRQADDPLDKIETGVQRIFENNDVASLRILETIAYLVNDKILAVLERRHH